MKKIIAIVGTYRKGRIIDSAVSSLLDGAQKSGAAVEKILLTEQTIEFCRNCRKCTIDTPDAQRGRCVIDDDMKQIMDKIDAADGLVLASPVNFGSVTAIMKQFIERLAVYAKWKLDGKVRPPKKRITQKTKRAVLITSSTMPALMGRILAPGVLRIMKEAAELMGADVIQTLWFGMLPAKTDLKLEQKQFNKAATAGKKLALSIPSDDRE